MIDRQIYKSFNVVVQLKEQVWAMDSVWNNLLRHVCYGKCHQTHLDLLWELIITTPKCPPMDYSRPHGQMLFSSLHSIQCSGIDSTTGRNNLRDTLKFYLYFLHLWSSFQHLSDSSDDFLDQPKPPDLLDSTTTLQIQTLDYPSTTQSDLTGPSNALWPLSPLSYPRIMDILAVISV